MIPVPLPIREKRLTEVRGVPKVSPEALQLRLNFLLGSAASQQQQQTPLKEGLTPYQAELFIKRIGAGSTSSSSSSSTSSSSSSNFFV
ncbi:hypothetical protein ACSSS7_008037 [Eimeria intestinalis]